MAGRAGPDLNEAWAREQQFHQAAAQPHTGWAAEFGSHQQQTMPGQSSQQDPIAAHQGCEYYSIFYYNHAH